MTEQTTRDSLLCVQLDTPARPARGGRGGARPASRKPQEADRGQGGIAPHWIFLKPKGGHRVLGGRMRWPYNGKPKII
jgi:hypothetical protein